MSKLIPDILLKPVSSREPGLALVLKAQVKPAKVHQFHVNAVGVPERLIAPGAERAPEATDLSTESPAEKKVSNFKTLFLTSLVWKLQSWQASEPSAFTVSRR